MGVYIPDVEMPKGDTGILLALYNGEVHLIGGEIVHVGKGKGFKAVAVPEPHGRLIDADALEQDAQKRLLICSKYNDQFQKPYEVMRAIALAPTVIPASGKE